MVPRRSQTAISFESVPTTVGLKFYGANVNVIGAIGIFGAQTLVPAQNVGQNFAQVMCLFYRDRRL